MAKGKIELPESMRRQQTLERRLWRALGLRDGREFGEAERRALEGVLRTGEETWRRPPVVSESAEPPSYAQMKNALHTRYVVSGVGGPDEMRRV